MWENSTAGTAVDGGDLVATDEDTGAVLTYTIKEIPPMKLEDIPFEIVKETGQRGTLKLRAGKSLDYETTSSYKFNVQVMDDTMLETTAAVTVLVKDKNEAPTMPSAERKLAENSVVGIAVGSAVTGTDPDGAGDPGRRCTTCTGSLTYAITASSDPGGIFAISNKPESIGQITVATASIDYETTSSYALKVTATDEGSLVSEGSITVKVTNVNEAPVFTASTVANKTISENSAVSTAVGSAVVATDVDSGTVLVYSLPASETVFQIDGTTGQITLKSEVLNHEDKDHYNVVVTVTDNGSPAQSTKATVKVNVADVNEKPIADFDWALTKTTLTTNENLEIGTVVGTLAASDPDAASPYKDFAFEAPSAYTDKFAVNSATGVITLVSVLNYETKPNKFEFTVTVRDPATSTLFDTGTVKIDIIDRNERPIYNTTTTRNISENSAVNAEVGEPCIAYDVDRTESDEGQLLIYEIVSITPATDPPPFKINPCTGQLSVRANVLDFETLSSYELALKVTDDGGAENNPLSDTATVTVYVNDVNEAPTIEKATREIAENSPTNTKIQASLGALPAADQDLGGTDAYTYNVTGGEGYGTFDIGATDGILTVKRAGLDYETRQTWTMTVTVTDGDGLKGSATVTVHVMDTNEKPTLATATREVKEKRDKDSLSAEERTVELGSPITGEDIDEEQVLSYAVVES
jgi:hypothetical protein